MSCWEERGLNIFNSKDVKLINIPFFLTSPLTIIYGMKKKNHTRVAAGQCPPSTWQDVHTRPPSCNGLQGGVLSPGKRSGGG